MGILERWRRSALFRLLLAQVDRLPVFDQLLSCTRQGMMLGGSLGFAAFLVLGALLGGLNRGWIGLVVGAISGSLAGMVLGGLVGAVVGRQTLPQEGQATISIILDRPAADYTPGEEITGQVQVFAEDSLRVHDGALYLLCRGIYGHDTLSEDGSGPTFAWEEQEYLLQQTAFVCPGILRKGQMVRYPFRYVLPSEALPTYRGLLCVVEWSVYALIEAPDIPAIRVAQPLLVKKTAPEMVTLATGYQTTSSAQACQLTLVLPRATFAEGETIEGRLQIMPLEDFDATEVRAVLLRIENVPRGDDHYLYVTAWDPENGALRGERQRGGSGTSFVWLESEHVITDTVHFKETETFSQPFALEIPKGWRPTFSTREGRALWKVGVVVERAEHSDVRALHEIRVQSQVASGPPL